MELNHEPKKQRMPRISTRQRSFLKVLCDDGLSPEDAYRRCNIKGSEFLRWLECDPFKRALRRVMRLQEVQYDFELGSNALGSIRALVRQTTSGDAHEKRLARVNVAGLFKEFRDRRVRRRIQKRKAFGQAVGPAMQELPPDLSPEESDRLLRIIEADAPPSMPSSGNQTS